MSYSNTNIGLSTCITILSLIKMARTSNAIMKDPEVIKAIEEAKARRSGDKVKEAKSILAELEGEFEHAKDVFFKVNGARRIIKNAEKHE